MIKSKGILTISIISLFAVESAYAAIASSGYVDQQVGTKISEVNATTVANDETANVVTSISAKGNTVTATKGITAEETKNKVKTIRTDGTAEDTKYPSEKAVATALDAKQDKLEGEVLTNTATGNSATAINADDAAGASSVALGSGASVGQYGAGGTAIGPEATVEAEAGIALGATSKVTAEYAIQLGYGTNSEAKTLSVGLDEQNNYKLLGIDGKIPAERLPFEGYVLTNTAMRPGSLSTGGAFAASTDGAVSIGPGSYVGAGSVAVGNNARAANNAVLIGSGSSMHNNVVIGVDAYGMADNAVSIGSSANADESSVAIGSGADAQNASNMIAIGNLAKTSADYAIQLGDGTNSEANTFSVGLSDTANYKLLGSDGKIPAERLPFEGDVLTNTSTLSSSFSTANANPATSAYAVAIGDEASTYTAGTAVGYQTYTETYEGTAVGYQAKAPGYRTVSLGSNANSTDEGASSIGAWSAASGQYSTGLGYYAKAQADYAIQLGAGTNSEANTLSVGLDGTNNYKLLGSDGKIPAERLPFEGNVLTNTATGTDSFSTGGATPVTENYVVALGSGASNVGGTQTVIIGYNAKAESSAEVAIGASASAAGYESTAVGYQATANNGSGTALGAYASAASSSLALGRDAKTQAIYSIQLGPGTNSEDHTFSVGFGDSNNYKLLGLDGKIPAERLPFEGDVLTNTATGNASFSTGNASPASAGSAVAIGENATVQNGGTAIGYLTSAGGSGVALGARASSNKMGGVSVGSQSAVEGDMGIAVGTGAQSAGESSISIGMGAGALSDYAIQLGHGMNAEANTLSVGLGTSNNYKLLGSDGKIPAERLPVARIPVGSETATSYASIWVE